MSESGLDPLVKKTMEITLSQVNTSMLHPNDRERWLSLFPALIAAGCTWNINDIYRWLDEHWPVDPDESGMDNHYAIEIYAWAEMALYQSSETGWRDWAEGTIEHAREQLGG
ncbi:MAG: hypothetical protein F4X17_01715 [Gemmatimonadetes bacterium]|nr:hypothetical protein [Gemmatimonadota bacterium]